MNGRWHVDLSSRRRAADQTFLAHLLRLDPVMVHTYHQVQAFCRMVRQCHGDNFDAWVTAVQHTGVKELRAFVRGLLKDAAAVRAGLSLVWSNEHMAYCTSSPASWPFEGSVPPATAAWRDRLWGHAHPGAAIMIARPCTPATAVPLPHGLFAHA